MIAKATLNDYTAITELPTALLTPDQIHRFAHRYGYAHCLARDRRVLEVACGAGSALNYLAQSAAWVIGLDYTGGVLHHARQATHVSLVQGDAQRLPFAAAHFDLILCFEAIYYLADYPTFLAECHRLLTPAGKLLICQSNPDWPDFVPGALTTRYPPLPELSAALRRVGFREVRCSGILPITASPPRQRLINSARRWITQSGLIPHLGPLKRVLQTMSYGKLQPLPPIIDARWIAHWQAGLTQTAIAPIIPATIPDRVHRVLYVEAGR
jgi:ubiquinone/menaquinone biosynthesis C-methylase UbiE